MVFRLVSLYFDSLRLRQTIKNCIELYILVQGYAQFSWVICVLWIVYLTGCDVRNFEINLIFQIKPFFYITKKSRQKFKYLETEKSF